jgi:PIN domain nuclease of toxin-antitoxin system
VKSLLLDTHVLLWWFEGASQLQAPARAAIANPSVDVFVSVATLWEIEIKRALGRLVAPDDTVERATADGFAVLAIGAPHAIVAGRLAPHHADPFDRMLVAQASVESLTLVTRDPRIALYDVEVLVA